MSYDSDDDYDTPMEDSAVTGSMLTQSQPSLSVITTDIHTGEVSSDRDDAEQFSEPKLIDIQDTDENTEDNVINIEVAPSSSEIVGDEDPEVVKAREKERMELQKKYQEEAATYFPGYKPDSVLRFQSLFAVNVPASISDVWESARKPKLKKKHKFHQHNFSTTTEPPPAYLPDDEIEFLRTWSEEKCKEIQNVDPNTHFSSGKKGNKQGKKEREFPEWRIGPAKLLFDQSGIPLEAPPTYQYNFIQKELNMPTKKLDEVSEDEKKPPSPDPVQLGSSQSLNPHAFLMITQKDWENDVIINPEKQLDKVSKVKDGRWYTESKGAPGHTDASSARVDTQSSLTSTIFPPENERLVSGAWIDDIVWDMSSFKPPKPRPMVIDPLDSELAFDHFFSQFYDSKSQNLVKKKHFPEGHNANDDMLDPTTDPFNISNDEYYCLVESGRERAQGDALGYGTKIEHSIPANQLSNTLFPAQLTPYEKRRLHRPQFPSLRKRSEPEFNCVTNLISHADDKHKDRQRERDASGGGDVFFMRSFEDLSAKDGTLILGEYCEEHPPLISMVGMSSRIITYYRKAPKGSEPSHQTPFPYGDTYPAKQPPFLLGKLAPGTRISTIDNKLFTSPVYLHSVPDTDFLLIRTREGIFIRKVPVIFCIGQQNPKVEVPHPNSRQAGNIMKDLFQVRLYRMFLANDEDPKRVKMEAVNTAFQHLSENFVRKTLRQCSDLVKAGPDFSCWVLKRDFRLPTEEELCLIISPEQLCTYYSMQAGEQRLRDAGYTGTAISSEAEDEDSDDDVAKIEDEIMTAPWRTTKHYLAAMQGKYTLNVNGIADPTGCNQGFAYMKMPKRSSAQTPMTPLTPVGISPSFGDRPRANIRGTDADLRKLRVNEARAVLKTKFNIPDSALKDMGRWKCIRKLIELSNSAVIQGDGGGVTKFARGVKVTQSEQQDKYRKDCQRIFDIQNKNLTSQEILSTDEDSSSGSETEIELARDLENIMSGSSLPGPKPQRDRDAAISGLSARPSSSHRRKTSFISDRATTIDSDEESVASNQSVVGRRLLIKRTYRKDGREYVRQEIVKNAAVIDAYVKINKEKGNTLRAQLQVEKDKEDMKRQKRKLMQQLRRIKGTDGKERVPIRYPHMETHKPFKRPYRTGGSALSKGMLSPSKTTTKKCSACGEIGHLRSNRSCTLYERKSGRGGYKKGRLHVAMTEEEQDKLVTEYLGLEDDLVRAEGVKLHFSKKLVDETKKASREALKLNFPNVKTPLSQTLSYSPLGGKQRKRVQSTSYEYLKTPEKVKRRRSTPLLSFYSILEEAFKEVEILPGVPEFMDPVSSKLYPEYRVYVKSPMDLKTIKENMSNYHYKCQEEFMEHISLLLLNSTRFNGPDHELTTVAGTIVQTFKDCLASKSVRIRELELEINPTIEKDPQISISLIFREITREISMLPEAAHFIYPLIVEEAQGYTDIVKEPIFLIQIYQSCKKLNYRSRDEFLSRIDLLVNNSHNYYGADHTNTKCADILRQHGMELLANYSEKLSELEQKILLPHSPSNLLTETVVSGNLDDTSKETTLQEGEILTETTTFDDTIVGYDEFGDMNLREEEITDDISEDEAGYSYDQVYHSSDNDDVYVEGDESNI
ncbi:Transcription initiation factor TFIID subunit 1 isoform X9 [Oopsacas minuta]|uniref:Transcription initiation factor TFIID subunit 1 isoform X9 n=1 Tax=Oopsacas minuta TaxID=111878 RepID=A0AAV7JS64_9METZ|nr:Transcription initiation factor TFIID subunit 1 isoform X9 [Oopsacas minuta]